MIMEYPWGIIIALLLLMFVEGRGENSIPESPRPQNWRLQRLDLCDNYLR